MNVRLASLALVSAVLALPGLLRADPRPWTFVEDGYAEGKGNLEYEQYVTFSHRLDEDHSFSQFQFKQEFEYGLTDNLDVSLYLGNFNYADSRDRTGAQYDESAIESIYYFTNPITDAVGIALYTELAFAEHGFDLENKLIFHKDVGNWSFAYNLTVETGFENAFNAEPDEHSETEGELAHEFGASYAWGKHWRTGAELTIESSFPHWNQYGDTSVYAGPNASYSTSVGAGSEFWLTVTPMFQLSDTSDEPDFVVRMIAGFVF